MGYREVSEAVKDTLLLHADFSGDNVAVSDYRVLGKGSDIAVVIMSSGAPQRQVIANPRKISVNWNLSLEIYTPWRSEQDITFRLIEDNFTLVTAHLDQYPTLNYANNIISALCTSISAPQFGQTEAGQFSIVTVSCFVIEHYSVRVIA